MTSKARLLWAAVGVFLVGMGCWWVPASTEREALIYGSLAAGFIWAAIIMLLIWLKHHRRSATQGRVP
jgi:hypothetical protein